ncbi:MAG: BRCT domain-containing protein, partial [Candidatus Bathyanammoxibius sp.]
ELAGASAEALEEIKEVGPVMAGSIVKFFSDPHTTSIMKKLMAAGVNARSLGAKKTVERSAIAGLAFVVTGTLEKYTRSEAEDLIKRMGGRTSSSVSKKTDYLLAGEVPGSKLDKARKLGVKVVTEAEFERLISPS